MTVDRWFVWHLGFGYTGKQNIIFKHGLNVDAEKVLEWEKINKKVIMIKLHRDSKIIMSLAYDCWSVVCLTFRFGIYRRTDHHFKHRLNLDDEIGHEWKQINKNGIKVKISAISKVVMSLAFDCWSVVCLIILFWIHRKTKHNF
jgi:hypothetical protein